MSDILRLQVHIQNVNALIAKLEQKLVERPGDEAVIFNLESLTRRRKVMEDEFAEVVGAQADVCSYRMIGAEDERPTLTGIVDVLGDWQQMVTRVYDAISTNRPKQSGKVGIESLQATRFGVAYVFTGSLGVMLTLPNEVLLLGETNLDKTMHTIVKVARAGTSQAITSFTEQLGAAPVRAIHKWAKDHVAARLDADIQWKRKKIVRESLFIQVPELEHLTLLMEEMTAEVTEEYETDGILTAVSDSAKTFSLRLINGNVIEGKFTDAINRGHKAEIPDTRYKATIKKTETVRIATDEPRPRYFLVKLERID